MELNILLGQLIPSHSYVSTPSKETVICCFVLSMLTTTETFLAPATPLGGAEGLGQKSGQLHPRSLNLQGKREHLPFRPPNEQISLHE